MSRHFHLSSELSGAIAKSLPYRVTRGLKFVTAARNTSIKLTRPAGSLHKDIGCSIM